MLRFLTAGESHGPKLTVILDGIPAGLDLLPEDINRELAKRQAGYGRSERMKLESDAAVFTAGVRSQKTTGAPIAAEIENRVFDNFKTRGDDLPAVTIPRPGHADLAGWAKYEGADIRDVIERASARETAARIVAGAVAGKLLSVLGIRTGHKIRGIAGIPDASGFVWERCGVCCETELNTFDPRIAKKWKSAIDRAARNGDSVGGRFECRVWGLPMGLGSYDQWDRRLDGRIARAVISVPGVKAVSIGDGFFADEAAGSGFRDPIRVDGVGAIERSSNHAGGLEGGVTNGEELIVHAVMKPISGVKRPIDSVDLSTGRRAPSRHERADTCAVHSAAVICENMLAWEAASALVERYGGDTVAAIRAALDRDLQGRARWWKNGS